MGKINVLDKNVSELIAAGEVIERPASIVKELLENSIDAGATAVTIEIQGGGVRFIRITDNGVGFEPDDVPVAFLRHATSKVHKQDDLEHIATLGFRGEALASIAAVSKIEMLTKTEHQEFGTRIVIHGGETLELDSAGCPNGTTILVRDLFYNVPARLKFLKKDVSEANAIQGIVEKIAISHPEISFKMIRENRTVLHTAGDNQLLTAIHAVYGKDFANSLIQVEYQYKNVQICGYLSKPSFSRNNRAMQHFFVNERYVKSKTCLVALEEGYKNSIMVSKFPACVLKVRLPYQMVDVNVHPAKIEVRFTDEKPVFDAVYFAVKSALNQADILKTDVNENKTFLLQKNFSANHVSASAQTTLNLSEQTRTQEKSVDNFPEHHPNFLKINVREYQDFLSGRKKPTLHSPNQMVHTPEQENIHAIIHKVYPTSFEKLQNNISVNKSKNEEQCKQKQLSQINFSEEENTFQFLNASSFEKQEQEEKKRPSVPMPKQEEEQAELSVKVLGELFQTYILCEANDQFIMIDKHAAHERILFEKLRLQLDLKESQILLEPVSVSLTAEECGVIRENQSKFEEYGFHFQFKQQNTLLICEAPLVLHKYDLVEIVQDIAQNILNSNIDLTPGVFEDLLHSIACRSAIKANEHNTQTELEELVRQIYQDNRIRHCPHGRPVGITMSKYEIEKKFGRHQ